MEAIKAFVGHSFAKENQQIVDAVLKYLKTVQESHPGFDWEHAEDPEPRGIHAKVLERFEGKNLFIGICTREERVVSSARSWWWPFNGHVITTPDGLTWKTSDWIIQEVGLAIGRGLKVILLLEEGVRRPGGIQGDLEYIRITRERPEASFNDLLAMLAKLTPKAPGAASAATDATSVAPPPSNSEDSAAKVSDGVTSESAWNLPKVDWSHAEFRFALFRSILQNEVEAESLINEKFLASGHAGTEEARRQWQAVRFYWHLKQGDMSSLARLKTLANESPPNAETLALLGQSYFDLEEFALAAVEFERASAVAGVTQKACAEYLGRAAMASHRAGHKEQADKYAERVRKIGAENSDAEHSAVDLVRRLAEARGETEVLVGTLERLLALNPADVETRFSLAFKYSELDRHDLAALHYLRIPESARTSSAWNNLGVELDELGLPIQSVHAYRKAEGGGETLAASNLALKLLSAGFLPETMQILEAAVAVADHHKNVDSSLSRAKDAESVEQKKADEALAKAPPVSDYYREFGAAAAKSLTTPLSGSWDGPLCSLKLEQDGDRLTATGTYAEPRNLLALALGKGTGQLGLEHATPATTLVVTYKCKLHGRVAVGTMSIQKLGAPPPRAASTLLGGEDLTVVLMRLSADEANLSVMERSGSAAPRFYDIVRT